MRDSTLSALPSGGLWVSNDIHMNAGTQIFNIIRGSDFSVKLMHCSYTLYSRKQEISGSICKHFSLSRGFHLGQAAPMFITVLRRCSSLSRLASWSFHFFNNDSHSWDFSCTKWAWSSILHQNLVSNFSQYRLFGRKQHTTTHYTLYL